MNTEKIIPPIISSSLNRSSILVCNVYYKIKVSQTFTVKYDDRKYKIKVKVYFTPIKGNLELLTTRYGENSKDYYVYISNDFQFCDNLYHNEQLLDFLRHQPFETVSYHHAKYEIYLK